MRRTLPLFTVLLALTVMAQPAGSAAANLFDAQVRAAMAPYYAALLTSARGDHEATLRHVLVFRGRWQKLQDAPAAARPAWAADGSVIAAVAKNIEAARGLAIARNSSAAHAQLEAVRAMLRDARTRAHTRTFDDMLTDYHEAMERLTGRAGLHNEIVLNNDDYAAIQEQVAKAAAAWVEIDSTSAAVTSGASWSGVKGATEKALGALKGAAAAKNAAETQSAAEALKTHYFELLAILSRA